MFHGRQTHHKINRLYDRALRIVHNDYVPSFQDLLNKGNLFTIHHKKRRSAIFRAIIWNSIPSDIRNTESYNEFHSKIKKLKSESKCRLYQDHVQSLGFLNVTFS